ncbi:MAG: hypothetical protein KDA41_12035 [Planctomycetales bacterium]|nr:hypothetical protein [Planctomycetales bacterium]
MSRNASQYIALWCLAASGCAGMPEIQHEGSSLPTPVLAADTVVLEMISIEMPTDPEASSWWAEVDEQSLPVESRRSLQAAGLRAGVTGIHLPGPVQDRVHAVSGDALVAGDAGETFSVTGPTERRLQCRRGQRRLLVLGEPKSEINLLWRDEGRVRGATFNNAQPMLSLRVYPENNGQARLELTPEIHHGAAKNRWVGHDGMFLMQSGKEEKSFEDLVIAATLAPGEHLLVTSSEDRQGLGEQMFCPDGDVKSRKVMILRLAQTQRDELHGESSKAPSLATSVD